MAELGTPLDARTGTHGRVYQSLAIVLCVVLGLLMILNNQMGGEAMWYWYASVFHGGVHLYSDLHVALQPLYLLLADAWMTLTGHRLIATEMPSLIQIGVLCLGLLLILRESRWPDWQKAIVLLAAFCFTVFGHSYRFDDYHILSENFIFYSILVLLVLHRTSNLRRQILLSAALGALSGLTITTRINDGLALFVAAGVCLLFILRTRRLASVAVFAAAGVLTVLLVVRLTGDSFSVYLSNTLFRAAASKGGGGSLLTAPIHMFTNTGPILYRIGKQVLVGLLLITLVGPLVLRFWRSGARYILPLQLAVAALIFVVAPRLKRERLLHGLPIEVLVLVITGLLYILAPIVVARLALSGRLGRLADSRAILILIPLAEWASSAAASSGEPITNYYAPVAASLLLIPILQPFRRFAAWATPSFLAILVISIVSTVTSKAHTPYSWQNYEQKPMFQSRAWFDHPVYGEMYIDRDLLKLSRAVCSDIGSKPGVNQPELLSLPYPFPNFFCDTKPWHNYVQTFFDTSTRGTIEQLMNELNTAPPEWIVYQRQVNILNGAERLYNHGKPLAQRDLDKLIAKKLATGQWKLVDYSDYLGHEGGGWYTIRTHP